MAHRLALATGRVDVDEMLDELTPDQWLQWRAYHAIEPFGDPWACFAKLCQVMFRLWEGEDIDPDDFRPQIVFRRPGEEGDRPAMGNATGNTLAAQEHAIAMRFSR